LEFTNPAGKKTQFFAPYAALSSVTNFTMESQTLFPSSTVLGSAGHVFTTSALQIADNGKWGEAAQGFGGVDRTVPPAMVMVQYSASDVAHLDESTLKLYYLDSEGVWEDASVNCGPVQRFPAQKMILAPVCQTGTFSLMGTQIKFPAYLPIMRK
jgi:hypothetical protein